MVTSRAKQAAKRILGPTLDRVPMVRSLVAGQGDVNKRIDALRALSITEPVPVGVDLSPGIRMDQDPLNPRETTVLSPVGDVLRLRAKAHSENRWTALHFVLGALDLKDASLVGVMIKSQSHQSAAVSRVCLRSGQHGKFRDFFFDKHLISTTAPGQHADFCLLDQSEGIHLTAEWRDLIIFFPSQDIDLSLTQVRFFVA